MKASKKTSRSTTTKKSANEAGSSKLVIALTIIAGVLIIAAIVALLFYDRVPPTTKVSNPLDNVTDTEGELMYHDVFVPGWNSTQVSVLGIRLGMTETQVIAKLGPADKVNEFDFGAYRNLEYSARLSLDGTGVTYHLEHGIVTRIIVFPPMNPLLHGNSIVNKTLAGVYAVNGIPQRQYDIKSGRFFVYNPQGFEEYISGEREVSYAFVFPNRKLPSTAVLNGTKMLDQTNAISDPKPPRLLLDTTTLCNEGSTFAFDTVTNSCKPYLNSCVIPDTWIEVKSCSANDTNATALEAAIQ